MHQNDPEPNAIFQAKVLEIDARSNILLQTTDRFAQLEAKNSRVRIGGQSLNFPGKARLMILTQAELLWGANMCQ